MDDKTRIIVWGEDLDDLSRYIINYYGNLMTKEETLVRRHLIGLEKISYSTSDYIRKRLDQDLCTQDSKVLELLIDGEEMFYQRVRDRILLEHRDEVYLNFCPRCGCLAVSPKARQCRKCHYDWHET